MITEVLLEIAFGAMDIMISFLPDGFILPDWASHTLDLLAKATYFFPVDVWGVAIGNIIFCNLALLTWSLIEWVYKKIPGVS